MSIKGPAIFLAQFAGDDAPFNNLENIEELKKELNEEKETLEIRNKSLKGQIDNLNNQISEMQNKLTPVVQSLQENKDQNAPQS